MKLGRRMVWLFLVVMLTGCMYPYEHVQHNAPPHPEQLKMVQESVDRFYADTHLLPIFTFDQNTPLYHRYAIDFNQLIPEYMVEPPPNAFERGGVYRYVLTNVEEAPQVKVIDLRLSQQVALLQQRINHYLQNHPYLPIDQMLEGGFFTLDYKRLGIKPPVVQSPYSGENLPLIVNQKGEVGIDYRLDLYKVLQEKKGVDIKDGEDIRYLLVEDSPFVPAHSFPYKVVDGEPVLIESWNNEARR